MTETEEVVIQRTCTNCNGYGANCDYGCKDCDHRRKWMCNCDEGKTDVIISIPTDVVERYIV
jgi:hypothetical protein